MQNHLYQKNVLNIMLIHYKHYLKQKTIFFSLTAQLVLKLV